MAKIEERLEYDGFELNNHSDEIDQLAKEYGKMGLIEKYTLTYIKSIMNRPRNDSILSNRNDLIKN